jgi:hypothetical protein
MRITGHGFLPPDDALRHSAKVVSGRAWDEILVLRSDIKLDSHPGWHVILGFIHKIADWPQDKLVIFSIVSLFILFCIIPVLFLRRPEAWLLTLTVTALLSLSFTYSLFLGRPYILTMAVVMVLSFLWPLLKGEKTPYGELAIIIGLITASTWIHCTWYLFSLVILAFFLAREWRAGIRLTVAIVIGILIGAALTGYPYMFFKQTLYHVFNAFGSHTLQRMLVIEFRPFTGESLMVIFVLGMLAWRKMRGKWDAKRLDNPVFILAILGWILGFVSQRFWLDWGMPALCVWMAREFQDVFDGELGLLSRRRLLITIAIATTLYLSVTNDTNSRWTRDLTKEYLSVDNSDHALWLPDKGGIIYSDDMSIFYDTFFINPHGPWRYILGFEPTMMPPEDLAVFRKIQWNFGESASFQGWVEKMKPEDRLILKRGPAARPRIDELQWNYAASGIWIGRLPRK